MNNLKLLVLALSLCSQINTFCDIYYNSPLSLVLLKDGVHTFLNESRKLPEHELREAIQDVIALAGQNNTNIQGTLRELETNLIQRIKKIESLGKQCDYYHLNEGLKYIAISAILGYGVYTVYKKWYAPDTLEYNAIIEELEKYGVKVSEGHNITLHIPTRKRIIKGLKGYMNDIILEGPVLSTSFARAKGDRLLEIRKSQEEIMKGLFMGTGLSAFSFLKGFWDIIVGLNPHYDDEFLDIYKSQLAWIQELHKSIIDENLENLKRDFINLNY